MAYKNELTETRPSDEFSGGRLLELKPDLTKISKIPIVNR